MMKSDPPGVEPNSVSSLLGSNCDDSESAATLSGRPCTKRKNNEDNDPYSEHSTQMSVCEPKRSRLESIKYTDEERQRVVEILEREFNKELQAREDEALLIEERIQRAQRTLHYLCYAVVSDFYSRDKTLTQQVTSTRQRRIHPAVKELLAGKHPKDSTPSTSSSTPPSHSSFNNPTSQEKTTRTSPKSNTPTKKSTPTSNTSLESIRTSSSVTSTVTNYNTSNTVTKVPRYIPPKPKNSPGKFGGTSRGMHNKVKQRIVIGNVSKWLPLESREDSATHKWMVYVRGPKDAPDVSGFVDKVRFFLHPSYRPNDVVQVVQPPFHLSRRGWGEFPVRVQIHFQDPLNKPVDVIHNLKLDRTCTGLQTLGAETIVDLWINKNNNIRMLEQPEALVLSPVEQDLEEISPKVEKEEEDTFGPSSPPQISNSCSPPPPPVISKIENSFPSPPSLLQSTQPDVSLASCNAVSTSTTANADSGQATIPVSPRKVQAFSPTTTSSQGIINSSTSKVQHKPSTLSENSVVVHAQPGLSGLVNLSPPNQSELPSTSTQPRASVPVSSSKILISSSSPNLVLNPGTAKASLISGSSVLNSSKAVILNRSALVPQLTTTSAIKSEVVSSPSSTNATKIVTVSTASNRLTEALQSNKSINIIGTKVVQSTDSPSKTVIPASGILTSSGQVIKIISPNKVLQNPNSSASSPTLNVVSPNVVRTIASNTIVTQNQNVDLKSVGKPISLVKYKAPDGSIRFLQVSQLNSKPEPVNQSRVRSVLLRNETNSPRQVVVRPASEVPVQRNPSPLIRLPAPSTVQPVPNQRPVLMFRDGKMYLVRPSPTAAATNQVSPVVRQPALRVAVPQAPVTNAPVPLILANPEKTNATQFVPPGGVTSTPALVNTIKAVPTARLMPDILSQRPRGTQGAQRAGVSLLKSNVLQQSSAPSPTVSPAHSPGSSPMHLPVKTVSHRVILPRPAMSPVSSSTYRTKLYKQMLSTVVRSCPTKSCAGGVGKAIRWMVRNLPLISAEARHTEYQVLHPYCAPDTNTFLSWNLGKQRACELMRAQTVWRLLQDVGWDESDLWTVREILIWARLHGYTIGLPPTDSESGVSTSVVEKLCNYQPISADISEWLSTEENLNLAESVDAETSDEELDIVNVNLSPSKVMVKQEPLQKSIHCLTDPEESIPLEEPLVGAGVFVNEVLNNVGIQLEPEQIVTGAKYPAAQRILVQAVQSLIDDIVRRSLAKAWGPNIARSPRSIEVPHVCAAILSRPEFDFLGCAGLGVKSVPSTTDRTSTSKMNPLNPS